MKELVQRLSGSSKAERIEKLLRILKEQGVPARLQCENDVINILAGDYDDPSQLPLFCAHHDVVPESSGANDNLASIAIVIRLLASVRCRAVFLDGEEDGGLGARLFCRTMSETPIECIIVLDVCGYGDRTAYWICRGRSCRMFRSLTALKNRKKYHLLSLPFLPESDDRVLVLLKRPLMRMSVLPEADALALKALETSPEWTTSFEEVIASLEVSRTIHGGPLDDPEYLMPESMERVVHHLQEACIQQHVDNAADVHTK